MIIRCDNCSVSLQLDETKIPKTNFTVRCPSESDSRRARRGFDRSAVKGKRAGGGGSGKHAGICD
jgi:predicted Zn finger-like uncharacterized protein